MDSKNPFRYKISMIQHLQFLSNVGHFEAVTAGAQIPLSRLALVYAENGRGKTTLTAILRSLGNADPLPIAERRRLGTQNQPHVVLNCTGGPPHAIFQNGAWNRSLPNVVVFDDIFVAENVCSGLMVGAEQRQNLHELILGAEGVQLNKALQDLVNRIETHNRDLRDKGDAIPVVARNGLSVDEFCDLPVQANVADAIANGERSLAAAREQEPIRIQPLIEAPTLPVVDSAAIVALLGRQLPDLQAQAAQQVREHLAAIGPESESWVANGMRRMHEPIVDANCPFCAQAVADSPVIRHYEAYFSEAYEQLKQDIADAIENFESTHSGDRIAAFERSVRIASEHRRFWSQFCDVPEINLDTAAVAQAWQQVRDTIVTTMRAKAGAPLEALTLNGNAQALVAAYQIYSDRVSALSIQLATANANINGVKQRAAGANVATLAASLARLKATQARHEPANVGLCSAYLAETQAKAQTETQRTAARAALENYRNNVFPAYQAGVNAYLERFQASFRLDNVRPANLRVGSTCNYQVLINNTPIAVGANEPAQGQPSFRTALSAGDRNTLALALFFSSIDRHPNRANCVVVIDDPVSSLDDDRTTTTIQHLRRLMNDVAQLVILSHNKPFLCRIWEQTDAAQRCALRVMRVATGSTITVWNANQDCVTEHDKRHAMLRDFSAGRIQASREVGQAIRPSIETFFRVSFPESFPSDEFLPSFRDRCRQRLNGEDQILDAADFQALCDIVEYANRFHHDNPAWNLDAVNDAELLQFTNRTLQLIRR